MLDHVTLRTHDLDGTCAFLEALLGLKPGYRPDFPFPGAWLYAAVVPPATASPSHLLRYDFALGLLDSLTAHAGDHSPVEFLHDDVAEPQVLRPAAPVAGLTLRITFEIGEAAPPASQGWGCLFVRHRCTFHAPSVKLRCPLGKASRSFERPSVFASVVVSALPRSASVRNALKRLISEAQLGVLEPFPGAKNSHFIGDTTEAGVP
jgi:catechol 2,3-dioxygenase-like lactoylglutathione lyase family enzyme